MPTNISNDKLVNRSNLVVVRIRDKSKSLEYVVMKNYNYTVEDVHSKIQQIDSSNAKDEYVKLIREIYKACGDLASRVKRTDDLNTVMESTEDNKKASVFTLNEGQEIVNALNLIIEEKQIGFTCELYGYSKIYPEDDIASKIKDKEDENKFSDLFNILGLNKKNQTEVDRYNSITREIKDSIEKQCKRLGYDMNSNPFLVYLRNLIKDTSGISRITNTQYITLNNLWAGKVFNDSSLKSDDSFLLNPDLYKKDTDNFEFIVKAYYWLSQNHFKNKQLRQDVKDVYSEKQVQTDDKGNEKEISQENFLKLRDDIIFGNGPVQSLQDSGTYDVKTDKINSAKDIENYVRSLESNVETYDDIEDEAVITDKSVSDDNLQNTVDKVVSARVKKDGNTDSIERVFNKSLSKAKSNLKQQSNK